MGLIKKIRSFLNKTISVQVKDETEDHLVVWVRSSEWKIKNHRDIVIAREYCRFEIVWDRKNKIGKVLTYGHNPEFHQDYSIAINVLNVLNGLIKQPTKYLSYSDLNNFVIESLTYSDCEKFLNDSLKKEDYYISNLIKERIKVIKENES